jgi:hypothetical protein
MLKHISTTLLKEIAETPEGNWVPEDERDTSRTLYQGCHECFDKLFCNMDAWHNFNSEMQRKQAFLIDQIRDAGNHLDGIRESNRMSATLHFINDSDLLNNSLKNEIINAMEKTNIEVKAKLQEDFKV